MELGRALRAARGSMKQTELAELMGTDQPTISKWERGEVRPSIENIRLLEEKAGRARGFVFIAAGMVDVPLTTRQAIEQDPALDDRGRRSVLASYEAMVQE